MNEFLYYLLNVVAVAAITAICRFLIPYLIRILREHDYNFAADIIEHLVRAAEQVTTDAGKGTEKFQMVFRVAKETFEKYKIRITDDQIENLIESAVLTMNHELVPDVSVLGLVPAEAQQEVES